MSSSPSTVAQFLARSTVAGEKAVARVRLVACSLVLLERVALLGAAPKLLAGDLGEWIASGGLLAGIGFSLATVYALKRKPPAWLPLASVLADTVLVSTILLPLVLWPFEGWAGVLSRPGWGFLAMAAVASGFRLTRTAVALGAGSAGAALFGLIALDVSLNGAAVQPPPATLILAVIVWLAFSGMGLAITSRTRDLVEEGAKEALKAERARLRLGVYVSQEIADAALDADLLQPGGERREVAVLFSDLRGFTTYSERLSPERLIDELNAYLDAMVEVIRAEGGVVDKYIGDAIMVVFGIPSTRADDALRAIRCARRMDDRLLLHNEERAARGLDPLRHGIGVHFGAVVAGNVGTDDRLQYTVVGDVVNTASRLEGATKELGVPVLVSADAIRAAGSAASDVGLQPAGALPIRGRDGAITVYTLSKPRVA